MHAFFREQAEHSTDWDTDNRVRRWSTQSILLDPSTEPNAYADVLPPANALPFNTYADLTPCRVRAQKPEPYNKGRMAFESFFWWSGAARAMHPPGVCVW